MQTTIFFFFFFNTHNLRDIFCFFFSFEAQMKLCLYSSSRAARFYRREKKCAEQMIQVDTFLSILLIAIFLMSPEIHHSLTHSLACSFTRIHARGGKIAMNEKWRTGGMSANKQNTYNLNASSIFISARSMKCVNIALAFVHLSLPLIGPVDGVWLRAKGNIKNCFAINQWKSNKNTWVQTVSA